MPLLVWFSSIQLSIPEFFHSDSEDHQVTIRTNPDAVLVIANGDTLGRTPLMKTLLPAGHVNFILTKDNFVKHDTSMFINPEQDSMLMFSLLNQAAADETEFENAQSAADSGMIRIRTLPDGVAIYKNNVYIGHSPVEPLQLSAGSYNFHFRKDGYDVQKRNVRVRAGSNRLLTVAMSGHTGSLEVISEPPDAQIWIDGQAISGRSTPAIIAQLSVGTHLLALKKDGHVYYEKEINISAKNTTKLTAELIAATGEVNILVKPWGSIFINNILKKKNSNVSFKEELVVGEHLVKIVHPSLGTWEKMVTIENDQRRELIIDFSKTVNIPVAAFDVNGKPVWAQIIVDDVPTGNITPKEISVRIGKRKISASIDGYELVNGARSLMLEQNLAEPLTFVLRRRI
jgi:hypothetical protein